jgi:uncharacterized phage protein (TIGR01671 family)
MNRDIEFRGKATNGEWVIGGYIQNEEVICTQTASIKFFVDPDTVGQFTGLKDKNGVKIFEGDIVSNSLGIGIVVYDNDSFVICWMGSKRTESVFYNSEWIEVIGNIHDNPELLDRKPNA